MCDQDKLKQIIDDEVWFHSINIGDDLCTKGQKSKEALKKELDTISFPDLNNKTVLDIGTYDGFYAFESERRGAKRVVALDKVVWEYKTTFSDKYYEDIKTNGIVPEPPYRSEWLKWDYMPDELPGKKRFDIAHEALNSKVETVVQDLMLTTPEEIGTFDIVLFLGVLYHLTDPFGGLMRVASLTNDRAIIETEAIFLPGFEHMALCEFFESDELNNDYSNWWAPNLKCLISFCRAAGFKSVEIKQGPPNQKHQNNAFEVVRYRLIVHALK